MWALGSGVAAAMAAYLLLYGDDEPGWGNGGRASALARALRASPALRRLKGRENAARMAAACERQMPEMLDVLALGLSAGLSFDASLALYCARSSAELSRQMLVAMHSWQMGLASRRDALGELAARVAAPSLAKFVAAVREALAFGAPLAATLERQADAIREDQRASVERRIEEGPVRMLIPLGALVVPAMLLAILGPLLSAALSR